MIDPSFEHHRQILTLLTKRLKNAKENIKGNSPQLHFFFLALRFTVFPKLSDTEYLDDLEVTWFVNYKKETEMLRKKDLESLTRRDGECKFISYSF